jgi:hypothetical protein
MSSLARHLRGAKALAEADTYKAYSHLLWRKRAVVSLCVDDKEMDDVFWA